MKQPFSLDTSTALALQESSTADFARRFGGIARLYGEAGLQQIVAANVCVIGIGGVGSWVAEALARSAVGKLTLIDMDVVNESNINRQLVAHTQTIGQDKIVVMQQRINNINPLCELSLVDDFISQDNLHSYINNKFDFVIDCIDDFRTKAALISYCKQHKIPILTVGGAGGQSDPSKVRQSDLSKTLHDVLLAKTRKLLRQNYSFARNLKRSFGVPCIYSQEQTVYPDGEGGLSSQRPGKREDDEVSSNALNCAGGMGSITHVTATFGMFAVSFVLNQLVSNSVK